MSESFLWGWVFRREGTLPKEGLFWGGGTFPAKQYIGIYAFKVHCRHGACFWCDFPGSHNLRDDDDGATWMLITWSVFVQIGSMRTHMKGTDGRFQIINEFLYICCKFFIHIKITIFGGLTRMAKLVHISIKYVFFRGSYLTRCLVDLEILEMTWNLKVSWNFAIKSWKRGIS